MGCNLKTWKSLDCMLTGVCAVINVEYGKQFKISIMLQDLIASCL